MADRPRNHVTAALADALKAQIADATEWPEIPLDLLLYLEKVYPPRCYRAEERVDDHLLYAGAQALVDDLREVYEEQLRLALGDKQDDSPGAVSVETPLSNGG